jgi:nucleotide-binding universal stress UspA family protein
MFKNVLVGADNSATALRAVAAAAELAATLGAKLHIVTAYKAESVSLPDLPPDIFYSTYVHPADALLAELTSVAKQANVEAEMHAATGEPATAIVNVATRLGADLIVVGNKGMRGKRRVLGSVPNSVAHHAPCAVLIIDTTTASTT